MNYHAIVAKRSTRSGGSSKDRPDPAGRKGRLRAEPASDGPPRESAAESKADSTPQPTRSPRAAWMERMRPFRAIRERDASIGADLVRLERAFAQRQRTLGDVIDAWNALAPSAIRDVATIAGLSNGTLTIAAAGSSASYEISRALRDGLERRLVERVPARVRRVKVKVGGATPD